ncbi:C39 family peptidase [Nocardioides sp. KIGAM211]|uniref:C39 family peptidase n=1 Tax=Nocardioides luti TaxID=2761101 RepID=A0A7X0RHB0_9ACTN|nr:C39 family peptidase [Nocardioides luti]MBB6628281.1 C39 family peptidase [Nocardioides luti]
MPRPRTIAIGALAALLVATPFIPRGGDPDGSLLPSGKEKYDALATSGTAVAGRVTPAMQAEIDRVVAQGRALGRLSGKAATTSLVDDLVRCANFEGQTYCLGSGWTESSPAEVRARAAAAARTLAARPAGTTTTTGDLDVLGTLRRTAALSPDARAAAERRELTDAARSVAKVWLLRHEIQGEPLPDGFLEAHPEARASAPTAGTTAAKASASPSPSPSASPTAAPAPTAKRKTRKDYPRRATVLDPSQVAEQERTYWCGPTTMQMITWGWKQEDLGQAHWADKLGTTTGGTAISDMVRVVNQNTGWDGKDYAGTYITLDIKDYTYQQWLLLTMRHIVDYKAPMIFHPILLKKYYPYLDDDASGHFQAGRGYDKRGKKTTVVSYFEPWNQQRFDPSEPYIARVQWRWAYKSYRANEAHFQHNIGV